MWPLWLVGVVKMSLHLARAVYCWFWQMFQYTNYWLPCRTEYVACLPDEVSKMYLNFYSFVHIPVHICSCPVQSACFRKLYCMSCVYWLFCLAMLQVSYVFLTSDFNSSRSLAHIHFTTFTLNAVHPNVVMPRLPLIGLNVLEFMGTELVPQTSEKLQILMQLSA